MAPKKRNSNTRFERLAALATALPPLAEEGETSEPQAEEGETSEPQASTATGEVAQGTSGTPLSFLVRFVESSPSMSLRFEARGDQLAKEAVEWASNFAILKFSAGLEASASDLTSYPSYPPTLPNGRELTVDQWLKMGHNPFVAVTSPKHTGFFSQREEARAELQKCREVNSLLINASNPEESSQEVKQAEMCAGCKKLSAALAEAATRIAAQDTRIAAQDTTIAALDTRIAAQDTIQQLQSTQIQELLEKMGDLQKVRRRNIIDKARKKILKGLKKSKSDVSSSWEAFFTNHDAQIRALGVSNSLFTFLAQGKNVLHKTVHEGPKSEMAKAVLSLKEGTVERLQFAEAFKFAFDKDVESFFFDVEDE